MFDLIISAAEAYRASTSQSHSINYSDREIEDNMRYLMKYRKQLFESVNNAVKSAINGAAFSMTYDFCRTIDGYVNYLDMESLAFFFRTRGFKVSFAEEENMDGENYFSITLDWSKAI